MTTKNLSPRVAREGKTIKTMITLYCAHHHTNYNHKKNHACPECDKLIAYSLGRLANCKHKDNKPTCGKCTIHCYRPDMQEQIKDIMKYSGPKMILRHPIMAIQHLIDSRRNQPAPRGFLQG